MIAFLSARGGDVNAPDRNGVTPLHLAARTGRADVLEALLVRGARVDANSPIGTPLHSAARAGQAAAVAVLLERGANVNARVPIHAVRTPMGGMRLGGESPLHYASASDSVESVRLLMSRGASIQANNASGWPPLLFAVQSGRAESVQALLAQGAPPGASNGEALRLASYRGHPEIVRLLLDHGADVNARDARTGDSALHRAVAFPEGRFPEPDDGRGMQPGHRAVVAVLLERGADPVARSLLGVTPLHDAASRGCTEAVGLMLDRGADPNVRDDARSTPLHGAAMAGQLDAARLLLDRGANVNARSEHNQPLHLAARFGHGPVVALLLSRGADARAREKGGKSPLEEAITPRDWTPELTALVESLLSAGADLHRSPGGTTPLHLAVRQGFGIVVDLLLKRGADLDEPDRYGRTPLHWAVDDQRLDMVELLVARGAAVNAQDAQRRTPLYYADGSGMGARIKDFLRARGGTGAFGEADK